MLNILKAADSNEKKKENIQMVWYVKIEVYAVSQMHLCLSIYSPHLFLLSDW